MPKTAYQLYHPERRTTSVVFASPHSGRDYSRSFIRRTRLNEHTIRSSEDAFVDKLFDHVPKAGAPFLVAGVPRAFLDLNRRQDELDPALIEGMPKGGHNPRVTSGLGVVPRVVANGKAIYDGKLSQAEVERRLERYWHPYHDALETQLEQAHLMFGQSILVDCHSMPHEAMDSVARSGVPRPEVVLGDRFGMSAGAEVVDQIEEAFRAAGLSVARNTPFAGAYIVQKYGRPNQGRHAVQIEIDRALYMNEQLVRVNNNFQNLRKLLKGVVAEITDIGRPADMKLAAE